MRTWRGRRGLVDAAESCDMPDAVRKRDVHIFGPIRTAWFKDPDGNIHALVDG